MGEAGDDGEAGVVGVGVGAAKGFDDVVDVFATGLIFNGELFLGLGDLGVEEIHGELPLPHGVEFEADEGLTLDRPELLGLCEAVDDRRGVEGVGMELEGDGFLRILPLRLADCLSLHRVLGAEAAVHGTQAFEELITESSLLDL